MQGWLCRSSRQRSSLDKLTLVTHEGWRIHHFCHGLFRVCMSLVKDQAETETVHESPIAEYPPASCTLPGCRQTTLQEREVKAEIASQCPIQTWLWWLAADQPCSWKNIGELLFELRQGRRQRREGRGAHWKSLVNQTTVLSCSRMSTGKRKFIVSQS